MNWKQYISQFNSVDNASRFDFKTPAPQFLLDEVKAHLDLRELPDELIELYKETDGVIELLDNAAIGELIWSVDRVIKTNIEYRTYSDFKKLYMSFDQLLFISDGGNGDLFAFIALAGEFHRNDIFVWNHEDDSRTWVAPNLKTFIEWWTNGKIQI